MLSIAELAYSLYIEDWKQTHGVTREVEMQCKKQFFCNNIDMLSDWFEKSYQDSQLDSDYQGRGTYVGYYEFIHNEYKDESYMKELLEDPVLIQKYMDDPRRTNERPFFDASGWWDNFAQGIRDLHAIDISDFGSIATTAIVTEAVN